MPSCAEEIHLTGLHPALLRSLTLQGYRIPTPIQRLSIPALLTNPPQDLVGMARTGSGKSLAYMIPLVQRLGGRHSTSFGARALILLPTRELALQILKVGKELARGWNSGQGDHAGDKDTEDSRNGQNLRWSLIVGGEGLDEQFEAITGNPDMYAVSLFYAVVAHVFLSITELSQLQVDCCISLLK
jgi:ATP-dependent RNA helicase DDX54/DBP10